ITVYDKGVLIYGTEPAALSTNAIAASSKDIALMPPAVDINKPFSDRLIIYPNPLVDTRFSVKLTSELVNQSITVRIRDAYGKIMQTNTFKADGDALLVPLSGTYPPGVYFVQLNNLSSLRIMVNQ
ncbi:MAG: T9SS type A sorting domain-containing protein, partial [Mucilaginibacter sp.]|uniref:T9SS type A sorting domain-containing protein n=1 Tax=Mucilaginibacter sp. TaxID=1882438 RepID=UPI0032675902